MGKLIHQADVPRTIPIDTYQPFDQPGLTVRDLILRGRAIGAALGPCKVWMLNSARSGGGVAEMMPRICALLNDAGVDTRWLVLCPDNAAFFRVTKTIHNMLHGVPGCVDPADLADVFDPVNRAAADELRTIVNRSDVLIVHDPQPLGVARYLPAEHRPRLLWRCHIGIPERTDATVAAWQLLRPYLEPYQRLLFSAEQYIPDELFERSGVLLPGIDPLSHKNRELSPYKLVGVLRSAGIVEGPPQDPWASFTAQAERFGDGGWSQRPIADLLFTPLVVQISRFDRLKGFPQVLGAFAKLIHDPADRVRRMRINTDRALAELGAVQLVLAGPDPMGVQDDPEAAAVLKELAEQVSQLNPDVARRVHLLRLPMKSVRENALMVNGLQRMATVIVQDSLQEGFGLTVTEAMWKGVPVVASAVGGIALQIRPGVDGTLVHDPTDEHELAEAMLQVLANRRQAEALAREAQSRVRVNFLMLSQIAGWLGALENALGIEQPARP